MSSEQQTAPVVDLMARAPKPFGQVLQDLMHKRDISYRTLAAHTRRYRPEGFSPGYLNQLAKGKAPATDAAFIDTMEVIARALDVKPDVFAEYRLAVHRRQFDEREVGLARALRNLERAR